MKTLTAFLVLLCIALPLQAAQDLTPQIAALLRQQSLEGAVWTTLDAEGAAGVSDAHSGSPMRAEHRVQVGSIAKTMLALGILKLVSEGRLSLDAQVAALLPGLAFDNRWAASDPVRIRHLLDHTAGLDDARLWQVFSLRPQADTPLAAAFPEDGAALRIRQRPGARFSYSNMGYTLLGMVIEAVAKQRYDSYLDAALLGPLGMHDSSFGFVSQDRDPRLAMGHFENGVAHPALPSYLRPAGQFTTTAADMARLARFLMSEGKVAGKPFIDSALLRAMGEPCGTEAARAGLSVGYGLGLRRTDRHGTIAKCHGGSTIGFRAQLCIFPDTGQAFFIAINTDNESADYHRFDALLATALVPARLAAAPKPARSFDTHAWAGFYIPAPNRFDSLRYVDTLFNFMLVGSDAGMLRLSPFQSQAITLTHVEGALFRAPGKLLASHALLFAPDGRRVISNGSQTYERRPLPLMLALWSSLAAGLLGLAVILIKGGVRLATRQLVLRDPLTAPFAGALALLLPIPFFYRQSYLQMGELTLASGLLAAATAALPLAMLAGLVMALRRNSIKSVDAGAMLAVLQLALVLAAWGLLPLRLWV